MSRPGGPHLDNRDAVSKDLYFLAGSHSAANSRKLTGYLGCGEAGHEAKISDKSDPSYPSGPPLEAGGLSTHADANLSISGGKLLIARRGRDKKWLKPA
jgi:hypothetical protein